MPGRIVPLGKQLAAAVVHFADRAVDGRHAVAPLRGHRIPIGFMAGAALFHPPVVIGLRRDLILIELAANLSHQAWILGMRLGQQSIATFDQFFFESVVIAIGLGQAAVAIGDDLRDLREMALVGFANFAAMALGHFARWLS